MEEFPSDPHAGGVIFCMNCKFFIRLCIFVLKTVTKKSHMLIIRVKEYEFTDSKKNRKRRERL